MSRPEILFPLFAPVTTLIGVGSRNERLLSKLNLTRIKDMIFSPPDRAIERVRPEASLQAYVGRYPILHGEIGGHQPSRRPNAPYRIKFLTDWGDVDLVYFRGQAKWLGELLPMGAERYVSGQLDEYHGTFQISHPDFIEEEEGGIPRFEAVYGLTEGLTQKQMRKLTNEALEVVMPLPEWMRNDVLEKYQWPAWDEAIRAVHAPENFAKGANPTKMRLAYDEILAHQLALALVRAKRRVPRGRQLHLDEVILEKARKAMPFSLTKAQERVVEEIFEDFKSDKRMFRMLQGDVGSGKTAVAYLAMAAMAASGLQSAMIAPTELLAHQHYKNLEPLFREIGFETVLLTGSVTGKARKEIYEALKTGKALIAIGTHALFQNEVSFHALGLSIIDEQHRFGVKERAQLVEKGAAVDLLSMSATPIPRTLAMSVYGEMNLSVLDEKPAGRQAVQTSLLSLARIDELVERLKTVLHEGRQAYWVCPLVEESEKLDLTAAKERFEALKRLLPDFEIGIVHGQMPAEARHAEMKRFQDGEIKILVATTVIEVGVDVPKATIMAIEGAERFGLSQLHQLRGRVGRGNEKSYCILIYGSQLGSTARERLEMMRETEDGFKIAEADLRLRGAGDVLGTAQSGLPRFRFADLETHQDLFAMARDDARIVVDSDPELHSKRGEALRVLLYLQEHDQSVAQLRKS